VRERRREFLRIFGAAGAAAIAGIESKLARGEPPPETTRIRFAKVPSICLAPQYVAEDLLRAEGFTDISYVGSGMAGGGVAGTRTPAGSHMGTPQPC